MRVLEGGDVGEPVGDPATNLEVPDSFAVVAKVGQVTGGEAPSVGELGRGEKFAVCWFGVGHDAPFSLSLPVDEVCSWSFVVARRNRRTSMTVT